MRAFVYVDGFNLYYRALRGTPYKWLDLDALARCLLEPSDVIEKIRYFSARVSSRSGDPDAPRKQQIYFNALGTLPNLDIHLGTFLAKTKRRPLVSDPSQYVDILDTEEKGSDVNLAVHLVNDGWHGRYDVALVMSQDTDLIEPLRIVKDELQKTVGLIWLDGGKPNRKFAKNASFVRHISNTDLRKSQFPHQISSPHKGLIEKPRFW